MSSGHHVYRKVSLQRFLRSVGLTVGLDDLRGLFQP